MLNAGSPTSGLSKTAFEALSAIMAKGLDGTGVTVAEQVSSAPRDPAGSHGAASRVACL
jgi:type IV secretory pathway TrbL component